MSSSTTTLPFSVAATVQGDDVSIRIVGTGQDSALLSTGTRNQHVSDRVEAAPVGDGPLHFQPMPVDARHRVLNRCTERIGERGERNGCPAEGGRVARRRDNGRNATVGTVGALFDGAERIADARNRCRVDVVQVERAGLMSDRDDVPGRLDDTRQIVVGKRESGRCTVGRSDLNRAQTTPGDLDLVGGSHLADVHDAIRRIDPVAGLSAERVGVDRRVVAVRVVLGGVEFEVMGRVSLTDLDDVHDRADSPGSDIRPALLPS